MGRREKCVKMRRQRISSYITTGYCSLFFAEWALQRVGDCGYARTVPRGTKKIPKVRFKVVLLFTYTEQELPIYLRLMHSGKQASR